MPLTPTEELLADVPLFAELSHKDLKHVAALATRLQLPAGRELTHQGGIGREFIVVLEGTVDVVVDGTVVNTCSAGSCFGEIALLSDRRRTATVVAKTDVTVEVIGRHEFNELLDQHPAIAGQLAEAMAAHLATDGPQPG
jgi:CRP-like cAMP-binding protein